jgi:glycosyltransferase involved in cell wall biosynthesis
MAALQNQQRVHDAFQQLRRLPPRCNQLPLEIAMRVSVVTPSFRNSNWLKLCVASVADQAVETEHIIQDNCSDDGTIDRFRADPRVQLFVEKDSGMYDAVNRGLRRATGDLLMYLNCDEQLLPGALQQVLQFFRAHPEIDVLFAGAVVVDENGQYICSRKPQVPWRSHILVSHLPTFSCATFFRRHLIERQVFFETKWRTISDAAWVLQVLQSGTRIGVINRFTSAFTERVGNLGLSETARTEKKALAKTAPLWAQLTKPAIVTAHRLRRLLAGGYSQPSFDYAVYTLNNPQQRTVHHVTRPRTVWKTRS